MAHDIRSGLNHIFFFTTLVIGMDDRSVFRIGVEDNYIHVIDDVIRLVMIQVIVQLMFFLNSPVAFPFFTPVFFAVLLYIIIGVSAYWLVFRKLVLFVPRQKRAQHFGGGG